MFLKSNCPALLTSMATIAALAGTCHTAKADTCPTLPNPIYGAGGSAITADLMGVAKALATRAVNPINIFYSDPSACTGFKSFVNNDGKGVKASFKYWSTVDNAIDSCDAPDAGFDLTFAHMGNPAEACTGVTVPAAVADLPGPIQTVNIVVPGANTTDNAISAEALYYIYGAGGAADKQVAPWTNNAHVISRSSSAFTQLLLSAAIDVNAAAFKAGIPSVDTNGHVIKGTNGQLGLVDLAAADASAIIDAIGFVSGSTADAAAAKSPPQAKTLAFKAKGQACALYPDSVAGANDKANVRNGQYGLWTPGHFFARVSGGSDASHVVDTPTGNLIGWFEGTIPTPSDVDVVALTIAGGDIPQCASQVTRDGLLGAIRSFQAPGGACTHFFEKKATGTTSGTACSTADGGDQNADCANVPNEHVCRHGFCEAY